LLNQVNFLLAMTVYSLNAVCCNYTQMRLIEAQNFALSVSEAEKLLPTTTLDCDSIERQIS